jgi:hypothetical protein
MKKEYIKFKTISKQEMDECYGTELHKGVDKCFEDGTHSYMQRTTDVLHVNGNLINSVHNSILDDTELTEIPKAIFIERLRQAIFDLEIYQFVVSK